MFPCLCEQVLRMCLDRGACKPVPDTAEQLPWRFSGFITAFDTHIQRCRDRQHMDKLDKLLVPALRRYISQRQLCSSQGPEVHAPQVGLGSRVKGGLVLEPNMSSVAAMACENDSSRFGSACQAEEAHVKPVCSLSSRTFTKSSGLATSCGALCSHA